MSKEKGKAYSHILKYTSLFGSIQMLNLMVGLIRNKLVAVILGPVGMGLASLFNSTIQLLCNTVNVGTPMSGVREVAAAHERGDKNELIRAISAVRVITAVAAVVGTLLCVLLARQLDMWTFSWGDHSLHFMLLAPAVGMTVIAAGEMAILKGIKRLRALARISVYQVFAVLFISVPLYYVWQQAAIVPVIILVALSQLVLVIWMSYRLFPPFSRVEGKLPIRRLLKLGSAFIVSGVMASGADFLIRTYINNVSNEDVGLFNAGFMLMNMYAGMVFASMEADYFPRLSSKIESNSRAASLVSVSRQVEVTLLLTTPMLVALMVMMPIVMPVLYSSEFDPVIDMVQLALIGMYFRSAYLPVEYIALASAHSRIYLVQESVSAVLLAVLVIMGYWQWGLIGAGGGIVVAYLLELLFVLFLTYNKFGYVLSSESTKIFLIQLFIGIMACGIVNFTTGWIYWIGGMVCVAVSVIYSMMKMRSAGKRN